MDSAESVLIDILYELKEMNRNLDRIDNRLISIEVDSDLIQSRLLDLVYDLNAIRDVADSLDL